MEVKNAYMLIFWTVYLPVLILYIIQQQFNALPVFACVCTAHIILFPVFVFVFIPGMELLLLGRPAGSVVTTGYAIPTHCAKFSSN